MAESKKLTPVEINKRVAKMPKAHIEGFAAMYLNNLPVARRRDCLEFSDIKHADTIGAELIDLDSKITAMAGFAASVRVVKHLNEKQYRKLKIYNTQVKRARKLLKKLKELMTLPHVAAQYKPEEIAA